MMHSFDFFHYFFIHLFVFFLKKKSVNVHYIIPCFHILIWSPQLDANKGLNKLEIFLGADSLRFNYSITNHQQMFPNYLA